ncbi:unnamed protein product [Darwinula stevensoni]|uniref:DUF1736 domain-containing protein n=1 Tax=Darwinula stevensoni TaxID=69355 RepID=A0A7R9A397_9CRUS|nr:unnamed protein product [Darwinula stevensoni]CAG0890274.1 unnamed protein product [Darwinula stevensoni]
MQHTLIAASGASLVALRWWAMGFASPIFQPEDNPAAFINSTLQRAINYQYIYTLNSWLMVNPHWLCFDWSMGCIPLINEITDPRVLAPLLFWLITGLLIWRALHPTHKGCHLSRDQRVIMLSLAWVIIPFLPASNLFFTVGFVIAERMLYLPSLGCATLVALGFRRLLSAASASQFLRLVLYGCLSWMLGMYSLKTWERSGEWVSENRLFLSGLRVCPLNAKVHYNIAKTAADSGDGDTAILHYQMALRSSFIDFDYTD